MRNCFVFLSLFYLLFCQTALASPKTDFWETQRKGANFFNVHPQEQWFKDAQALGLQWVRLTYDKWKPAKRDFLIGNADHYEGLVASDLKQLKQVLDWANQSQIKVVIAPLSLPGCRWSQNNDDKPDLRLWNDKQHWQEAALFWQDLARELKDHPAVYAYNLINEPTPERQTGLAEHGSVERYEPWYEKYKNTSHDLPAFYQQVITAIRQVDPDTPIMLDAGWYAQPSAFTYWPKINDPHILYAFHMYEPYEFTNQANFKNKTPYAYPGVIPYAEEKQNWDKEKLEDYFLPFFYWAKHNQISSSQIVAAEFGCYRRNTGCQTYLEDLISIFNRHNIHWAFYSYREDQWDGYDYELGMGQLDGKYWEAYEKGDNSAIPRQATSLFNVIKKEFQP